MKKPAASRRAKPAPNVVIVDKVAGLAAWLERGLRETGWSTRGLALAAGLNAERLRNVARGRSTALQGDAVALVAEVLGTSPGVLTGAEPWPVGGLQPRTKPAAGGKRGFALSLDPLADLVRAAEMASEAANIAATAATQAAAAVRMAVLRRETSSDKAQDSSEVQHPQPKASKVNSLDRIAYRMRFEGMVRILDSYNQVQLGEDKLAMKGWSPLVAVTHVRIENSLSRI